MVDYMTLTVINNLTLPFFAQFLKHFSYFVSTTGFRIYVSLWSKPGTKKLYLCKKY